MSLLTRRSVNSTNPSKNSIPGSLRPDIDSLPKPWPFAQFVAFVVILCFAFLQLMPPTHVRDPSNPFRNWIPVDSDLSSSSKIRASSEESSVISKHEADLKMVHIVSWMDCLDLRVLAVLVNSTLSSSRYPEHVYFHFFIPNGTAEKLSYYKLKVLFPNSKIDIIGQREVKEKLKIATFEEKYAWPSLHEVAPFIIPSTHPSLSRFIYVKPDIIMKGSVEELFEVDLSTCAIAGVEDCSRSLSSHVNFDVLNAIQRSAAKPWIYGKPYDKNACAPNPNALLINANKLEKDLMEAVIWWSKVLNNKGSKRNSEIHPAIVLALYDKYLKLSTDWKVRNLSSSITNDDSRIIRFDGPKKVCLENENDNIEESKFGDLWEQYLPPMSDRILGN